ncbi:PEP-CTERM sorting domain-containing protein [bacterium]|nr:MAG: PEP-CTERM sorting domain-containing protein [bacterium]
MINRFYGLTLTVSMLSAGFANATLLNSFETGIEGFESTATLASSPLGASEGSMSLSVTFTGFAWIHSTGSDNAKMEEYANALLASSDKKLYIDYTVLGSGNGAWADAFLALNDGGVGWRQTAAGVNVPTTPGTHTVALDYSALAMPNYGAGNWFRFSFSINGPASSTAPLTVYIDNIRTVDAVPEPASIVALGVGLTAILRKRRSRLS